MKQMKHTPILFVLMAAAAVAQRPDPLTLQGPERIRVKAGQVETVSFLVFNPGPGDANVDFDVNLTGPPNSAAATVLLPAVQKLAEGAFAAIPVEIRGSRAGEYQLKAAARSREIPRPAQLTVPVEVEDGPRIYKMTVSPAAIRVGESAMVQFGLVLTGEDLPHTVPVEGPGRMMFQLNDDGRGPDNEAGDGIYRGEVEVSARGMSPGQCLEYRGIVGMERTRVARLCATALPVGIADRSAETVFEPAGQGPVLRDEIAVIFKEGTPESVRIAVAASVGGTIVGTIPRIQGAQVRLQPAPRTYEDLLAKVRMLAGRPGVKEADVHGTAETQGMALNDTDIGKQWHLTKVRADQAWLVSRGKGQLIGIVDTGVRYLHDDLVGRVVKGYDYRSNDPDPFDEHGHGTLVAGIAAAHGNNGTGVAGVAWEGRVFAPRVLATKNNRNGNVAAGMIQAMDSGARIVNASLSSDKKLWVCSAAEDLAESGYVLVAAAGNYNSSERVYPAGCGSGVVAVGNLTSSDKRNGSSNFGAWVGLAAPGTSIHSTLPVGQPCTLCGGPYGVGSGTSAAAPVVAGTMALMVARDSKVHRTELIDRLYRTTAPLPDDTKGFFANGRVDAFEAVFNGSFESGLDWWKKTGMAVSFTGLGTKIKPVDRKSMAVMMVSPIIGKTASIRTEFAYPQAKSPGITVEARVALVAPVLNPGAKLTMVIKRDGGVFTYALADAEDLLQPSSVKGMNWNGWKYVSVYIPTCDKVEISFHLTDGGSGNWAFAVIDQVELF